MDLWDAPELGHDAGLASGTKEAGMKVINNLDEVGSTADVIVDVSDE